MQIKIFLTLIAILLLSSCTRYPLGMSEAEFYNLSSEQQFEARKRQSEIDEKRMEEARKLEIEKATIHAERVRNLYANPQYGSRIHCTAKGGVADFYPGWHAYQPQSFTLVRGEERDIEIFRQDKKHRKTSFWISFADSGLRLDMCRNSTDFQTRKHCQSIIGNVDEFEEGFNSNIRLSRIMKDATMFCKFAPRTEGNVSVINNITY